jgi:uncharacterized membrane protein YraQ (UPF0718 family)
MPSLIIPLWITDTGFLFLSLFVQGIPFLLVGAIISSFVATFLPMERLLRRLPRHPLPAALLGTLAGFLIPTCECAAVPLVRRLLVRGLPASAALGYLFGSPALNPIALISTFTAYQGFDPWLMTASRAGGSFFIASFLGWWLTRAGNQFAIRGELLLTPSANSNLPANLPARPLLSGSKIMAWIVGAWNDFWLVAVFFVLGCLIAALLQVGVPSTWLPDPASLATIPYMMLLAFILSICSSADAFVANSFVSFPLSSHLAFMWTGPVLDIKLLLLYGVILTRRALIAVTLIVTVIVLIFSLIALKTLPF